VSLAIRTAVRRPAQQARRLVPVRALSRLVRARVDRLWEIEEYRDTQVQHMTALLEFTERADEIPVLARRFAEEMTMRTYIRWHPHEILRQDVRGIERLTSRRDPERSVVVSFLHHAHYEGIFASLDRGGAHCHVMVLPSVLEPGIDPGMKQHIKLMGTRSTLFPASGGTESLAARMQPGMNMAIASDVPGRTPVTFLGREVLGSSGAARIAMMTNSPVVVVTTQREGDGSYLQVHEALDPADFDSPEALLDAMLRIHERAVLAWPEVLDMPLARFGQLG